MNAAPTCHQESFVLRRGLMWVFIPRDQSCCPLLTELCGDSPSKVSVTWEDWPTLDDALRNIREVAAGMNISVTVCGDRKRSPTIILRRKAGDNMASEPAIPEQRINLKWCVFGEHRETWLDHGHGGTLQALEGMQAGQWLKLVSSPSKECRSASVVIRRTGASAWRISGVLTDAWDDAPSLAETLRILLIEELAPQDGPLPESEGEQLKFLAAYNQRHQTAYESVMDDGQFMSAVPMSPSAMGPGVDLEFDRKIRGGVDRLLKVLSGLEDDLIGQANDAWADLTIEDDQD